MPRLALLLVVVLPAVVTLTACSSSSCSSACKKVERCYGETGKAPACTLSASCGAAEQCRAKCINNAGCGAITGADVTGLKGLQTCIAACASVKEDSGVHRDGVTWYDGTSSGDDLGKKRDLYKPYYDLYKSADLYKPYYDLYKSPDLPKGGAAVGKFCNNVLLGGQPFTATFKLGTGASQVTFVAASGACSPLVGTACPTIPTGSSFAVEVLNGSTSLMSGTLNGTVAAGEEWLFLLDVNASTSQAELTGGKFNTGYTCKDTDPLSSP